METRKLEIGKVIDGINNSCYAPKKWKFSTIEQILEDLTAFGYRTKFEIIIVSMSRENKGDKLRFNVSKYDNGTYAIFYCGTIYNV